jgi:electron transport complex protein RnfA
VSIHFSAMVQIAISAILINNIVLSRFLGLCPFFGVSNKLSHAFGMGMAVIFVMTVTSILTFPIDRFLLVPLNLEYLRTIVFVLVIASLVQLVEMAMQKYSPLLYDALGIYLPLITTNCAILGIALINTGKNNFTNETYTFLESLINGMMSGVGFMVALVLMTGVRERLEMAKIPKALEGLPIAFISAGLIAIAFLGFSGLTFF